MFPGAPQLLRQNREEGFLNVLLTGSLDFAVVPFARSLGFDRVVANRIEFRDGVATGALLEPVLAGTQKAVAIAALCSEYNVESMLCRAYSDDLSDLPMLEAVGHPVAANPKPSLRTVSEKRGWAVADLR
jgi:HAD superfamily hydrolase (TIGR01490 family)